MLPLKEGFVVKLVPFAPEHAEKVFEWYYDVAYKLFFREFDAPLSLEQCRQFNLIMAKSGVTIFMIIEKETNLAIGMMTHCPLKRKSGVTRFGILLDKNFQHKTYAIEALIILGDFVYNRLGFRKLVIEYLASDTHIRRISEKGGWIFETILKEEALIDGEYVDEVRYHMFKKVYDELYGNYFDGMKQ